GLGLAAVTELAATRALRLVALDPDELERLTRALPAYSAGHVPANSYRGVDRDVPALAIWSAVVVHPDLPASLAYELTCTIFRHREALLRITPAARAMRVEDIHRLPAVPLHAGTRAWLDAPDAFCRPPDA
ncbi:MAG: TAXI family TRAP transporter solute-binding subunit, partial [Silicimonas sp.]|nr:TAXI family TRAP transporter solute-binding subunit [Silicimonas sp.]